ncbi:MAG: hypothetical protein IPK58_10160 [Acidobacteria bacterium]|nr:hypothetical protein [Acidobacteriota bacterium]
MVTRTYNSMLQSSGVFGPGWRSTLDESLTKQIGSGGDVLYLRLETGDGRLVYFFRANTGPYRAANPGFNGEIVTAIGGGWILTFLGMEENTIFIQTAVLTGNKTGTATRLHSTTLRRTARGQLTGVTDPFGRTLTVVMANGIVSKIYDSLSSATTPIASYSYNPTILRLESVTYRDQSRFDFEYDLTTVPGSILLTKVKDAQGKVVEQHQYDSQGRALTSERATDAMGANGQERYEIDYSFWNSATPYTRVTHRQEAGTPLIESKYYFEHRGTRLLTSTVSLQLRKRYRNDVVRIQHFIGAEEDH